MIFSKNAQYSIDTRKHAQLLNCNLMKEVIPVLSFLLCSSYPKHSGVIISVCDEEQVGFIIQVFLIHFAC